MALRLLQILGAAGERLVAAATDGSKARRVNGATTVHALAMTAIASRSTLAVVVNAAGYGEDIDLHEALQSGRILAPVCHPDCARVWLTGTGLTHLGSADARDRMHAK